VLLSQQALAWGGCEEDSLRGLGAGLARARSPRKEKEDASHRQPRCGVGLEGRTERRPHTVSSSSQPQPEGLSGLSPSHWHNDTRLTKDTGICCGLLNP
jgi:hypothetical protein